MQLSDSELQLVEALKVISGVELPEEDRRCQIIVDKDGFKYLTVLLARYEKKPEVLEHVMTALCRLASADKYADRAIEAGVVEEVIRCVQGQFLDGKLMQMFDEVLGDAILLLGNLAYNALARDLVRQCDGIRTIMHAMVLKKHKVEIIDHCCYTLANLSVDSSENMEQIVSSNHYFVS